MAADDVYENIQNAMEDRHKIFLSNAFDLTERDMVAIIESAPDRAGRLFDLEWAVNARAQMLKVLEQDYLSSVQTILGDYRGLSDDLFDMLNNYGDFTKVQPEVIAGLQRLSFQGFEALATSQLDTLANGVYQATLAGRSKQDVIQEVRGSINGIYQASDKAEIEELVEVAKTATGARQQAAVDRLHSVYNSDRLGNNLRRYATTYATDSINQFSASLTIATANEVGVEKFRYRGDVIRDSREFCRTHVNQEYTRDEIDRIWSGSWAGKSPGDPFIVRGGYNCRHRWIPVIEE